MAVCPNYLDYELAVLRSNVAACHLKLEEWRDAIKSATAALDGLDRLERAGKEAEEQRQKTEDAEAGEDDEVTEEIVSAGARKAAPAPPKGEDDAEAAGRKRREDIARIRAKALMRRARARSEAGGWSSLAGAEEDYKALAAMTNLGAADRRIVREQLRVLPPQVKAAQERETAEMWGKLKDVSSAFRFGPFTEIATVTLRPWSVPLLIHACLGPAWKRDTQALWSQHGQLPDGQGREERGLQHELQAIAASKNSDKHGELSHCKMAKAQSCC